MRIKAIIGASVAGVLLLGAIVGVVMAQEATPTPQPSQQEQKENPRDAYLEELAKTLGVDVATLKNAMEQTKQKVLDQHLDEAMANHLERLVQAGKLTQEEANAIATWWQARPEVANQLVAGMFKHHKAHHGPKQGMHRGPRPPMGQPGQQAPQGTFAPAFSGPSY